MNSDAPTHPVRPDFHPRPVEDGRDGQSMQLIEVGGQRTDLPVSRRGLFGAGVGVATALAMLGRQRAGGQSAELAAAPSDRLYAHIDAVLALATSADGRLLATASADDTIKIWSLTDGSLVRTLNGHGEDVTALAFTPDGRVLYSGSNDDTVRGWTVADGAAGLVLRGHTGDVRALVVTSDGALLISASSDATIRVWSLPGGRLVHVLEGHSGEVTSLALASNDAVLASGSADRSILLWDPYSGTRLQSLSGHTDQVLAMAFSPDGRYLASGSADQTVRLWYMPAGTPAQTLAGHTGAVVSLAISSDAKYLVSGGREGAVRVWVLGRAQRIEIRSLGIPFEQPSRSVPILNWEGEGVLEEAETPAGPWVRSEDQTRPRVLLSGAASRFYRLKEDTVLARALTWHTSAVQAVRFSVDGRLLFSGDGGGAVMISDVATGAFRSFLFDVAANRGNGLTYRGTDPVTGLSVVYTLPCGTPRPANTTCVCDCVTGTRPSSGGGGGCAIIVCTCNRIWIPSDRDAKTDVRTIDPQAILDRVATLNIQGWRYRDEADGVRHVGPMAQDFAAAFGLGTSNRRIEVVDAQGVSLAAIQALHELHTETLRRLARCEDDCARLAAELERVRADREVRRAGSR